MTTLRLGGPAAHLTEPTRDEDLIATVGEAKAERQELYVLGGGSNVVVADAGLAGIVMRVATQGIHPSHSSNGGVLVDVAAGENWDEFVAWCVHHGYAGIEALSGIPGSVGATPIQNVGAYGQAVGDVIKHVRVFDRLNAVVETFDNAACRFGYRTSIFKEQPDRWLVLRVRFELQSDTESTHLPSAEIAQRLGIDPAPLADIRDAVLDIRRDKGMLLDPADPDSVSAGSFFVNPVLGEGDLLELQRRVRALCGDEVTPSMTRQDDGSTKVHAAWLIERAGFPRGSGNPNGIALSSRHALVLTNRGAGSTAELLEFARTLAKTVHERFGLRLKPEPRFLGVTWEP